MKKILKIVAYLLGLVVALVVVAAIAVALFFDANAYRDRISSYVKEQTGRELQIQGDLSISVFPWVGLQMGATRLGNAPGFGDEPFAQLQEVNIRVKLGPLLRKEVVMDTLVLDGVQLNLVKNRQGVGNWEDLGGKKKHEAAEKPEAADLAARPFSIGGIEVRNARLSWNDRQSGSQWVVDKVQLRTGTIAGSDPVDLRLSLQLQDAKAGKQWPLDLSGRLTLDLPKESLRVEGLIFQLADVRLNGVLNGKQIVSAPSFSIKLDSNEFVPTDLMLSLGMSIPKTRDAAVLSKASLSASVSATGNSLRVDPLVMRLDDSKITGNLIVQNFASPAIRYQLKLDSFDADRYLPPPTEKSEGGGKAETAGDFPVEALRTLNMKGELEVGTLKAFNIRSTRMQASVNAANGVLRVFPASAQLYEGAYSGDLTLDVRGAAPVFSMNEKLTGIQAEPLFKDVADLDWIKGKANFSAQLRASGKNAQQMRETLSGNAQFAFLEGAVKGVNILYQIRSAYALLMGQPAPAQEAAETQFSQLTGTATVDKGVVSNQDLALVSPVLQVTGNGTADLVREQLDYQTRTTILASLPGAVGAELDKIRGKPIPVRISGPFASPKVRVELDEVMKEQLKQKVQEKVDEKIKEKLDDKLKDKFKDLFKR